MVTLGGRQSATRVAEDPFLAAEVELLQTALRSACRCWACASGAQLLAVAAGGRVSYTGAMNAGWPEMTLLPAAAGDPLFGAFPARLPGAQVARGHHRDAPAAPPSWRTTPGPGAALFRVGERAWGSQAHLELTPPMLIEGWTVDPGDIAEIEGAGHRIEEFRAPEPRPPGRPDGRGPADVHRLRAAGYFLPFFGLIVSVRLRVVTFVCFGHGLGDGAPDLDVTLLGRPGTSCPAPESLTASLLPPVLVIVNLPLPRVTFFGFLPFLAPPRPCARITVSAR